MISAHLVIREQTNVLKLCFKMGERLVCMTSMGPAFDGAQNRILALSATGSLLE